MNNMPPNSASRRPEGGWQPPEDDDFKIMPPPNAVSSPVSSPVSAPPPPPPVTYAPPRPPAVVAPTPGRAPAPAKNNQRLFLGIGAAAVLLAAVAFFFVYQMLTGGNTTGSGVGPVSVVMAATAVADNKWDIALPGCAGIGGTVDPAQAKAASQALVGCGLHLLKQDPAEVTDALRYFKRADTLSPGDDIKHQIDLAQRYLTADLNQRKDQGGSIGQFEWFGKQPEFAKEAYADAPIRLYQTYVDSGNGSAQLGVCDVAQHRFEQAVAVKFVKDNSLARRRLDEVIKTCGKPATPKP